MRRWSAMIQPPHIVDEADDDMRMREAPIDDGYRCRTLRAVAEYGCSLRRVRCYEIRHQNGAVAVVQGDVQQIRAALYPVERVRIAAHLDRMDGDAGQILGQQPGRLPGRPPAFDEHLETQPARRVDDQRHLGMDDAARLIWLRGDGLQRGGG